MALISIYLPMPLPARQVMDIRATVETDYTLAPGERNAIPCGFAIAVPPGYEAQIRPRSGLALKHGVTIANAPGTIDSDYRGEIVVIMINLGSENFIITRGMRIAQMVIAAVALCHPVEVSDLDVTARVLMDLDQQVFE